MPSGAFTKFESNMLVDVSRMVESHGQLNDDGPGRRGLGHITRGGVLLLCAAWELYLEELLIEAVEICIARCADPDVLPEPVKHTISDYVRASKHHFKPLAMSGDGWQTLYLEIAREHVSALNTPKRHNIDAMFLKLIGLADLSDNWSVGPDAVNDFVSARGDIAHRGKDAGYVTINRLRDEYIPQISRTAIESDNFVSLYLRNSFEPRRYPWNRRNIG
ncbi:HEPN domain-containing protein [Amorphus sp. 3PC139-8]|uniref:HEPN domain-containing protein n=1 Tax=Amorphus sp. 3PC139-8 TaxID=2735676 RepID=UPI00345D8DFC